MDAAGVPRSRPPVGRRGRLTRSAEFDRVYRQGRSFANRYLALYSFPRADEEGTRLGLSVGRKVGGAVHRNQVKRLLREAFAGRREAIAGAHDVVIVARPGALELAERDGLDGVRRVCFLLALRESDRGGRLAISLAVQRNSRVRRLLCGREQLGMLEIDRHDLATRDDEANAQLSVSPDVLRVRDRFRETARNCRRNRPRHLARSAM